MYSLSSIIQTLPDIRIEVFYPGNVNALMTHLCIPDVTAGSDIGLGMYESSCMDPGYSYPFGIILSYKENEETKYLRILVQDYNPDIDTLEDYEEIFQLNQAHNR